MTQKKCSKCDIRKPLDSFGLDSQKKSGRCSRCKSCRQEDRTIQYIKHRERELPATLRYYYKNRDRAIVLSKTRYEENKKYLNEQSRLRQIGYRNTEEGRQKDLARQAARRAVKKGKLVKLACEKCGNPKSEAHHHNGYDYRNRLNVTWLCLTHHKVIHRKVIA